MDTYNQFYLIVIKPKLFNQSGKKYYQLCICTDNTHKDCTNNNIKYVEFINISRPPAIPKKYFNVI